MSDKISAFYRAIPDWTARGLLPPVGSAAPTALAGRSPFRATIAEVVARFATTPERRAILDGLLRFRKSLLSSGIEVGFQWLDGSFVEDVEKLDSRAPNDIDVVTWYEGTPGENARWLTDRASIKNSYSVDAFFEGLGQPPERLVSRAGYWYGVWSHRRTQVWKGFVEVPLGSDDDAQALLDAARKEDAA